MTTETTERKAYRVVRVDETDGFNLGEYAPWIEKVYTYYMYDPNVVTHLCEFAGSYYMIALTREVIFCDDTPESVRQRVWDETEIEHVSLDENTYMHCVDVDKRDTYDTQEVPVGEYDDAEYQEHEQETRDALCENCSEYESWFYQRDREATV